MAGLADEFKNQGSNRTLKRGETTAYLLARMNRDEPISFNEALKLASHGGDRKSDKYQPVNHSLKYGSGNKDYSLARLKRDHPEILAKYEAGEFPSVRQAAIAAGIIKEPTALEKILKLRESQGQGEAIKQLTM